MEFTEDTERVEFGIQKVLLTIIAPFEDEHICTPGEAEVLNQTLRENVRNTLNKQVLTAVEEAEARHEEPNKDALQRLVDEYIGTYAFGGGRRKSVDPVKRRALHILREKIKNALRAAGRNLSDITTAELNTAAEQALNERPQVMDMARTQIEQERALEI